MEPHLTAFVHDRLIARGDRLTIVRAAHIHADELVLVFDDATGRPLEFDLRGTIEDALRRLAPSGDPQKTPRGRPRLGVTPREVTLLPRHWEWLATQSGGASAALRRLVDQARRETDGADNRRKTHEATYRVMTALAGNLPDYEEATRALFANDQIRFDALTAGWPKDVGDYVRRLNATTVAPSP